MSQTQEQTQINNSNEIQIKKRVILYIHNDGFSEKSLEPLILINGKRIHIIMLKKKWNTTMYYVFENKKYMKLWEDSKGNILTYIGNWNGDMFIDKKQNIEYIDYLNYTVSQEGLICEDREGKRKKLILQGFDILPLIINEFEENANAILYILCTKLS